MVRVIHGSTNNLPDVEDFIRTLNTLPVSPMPEARNFFDPDAELVVTRAPGRLDVMGGIADYSGSLVLQLPISKATVVALERDRSRTLKIISLEAGPDAGAVKFDMPLADLESDGRPIDCEAARLYFQRKPKQRWAAYAAGAFLVLMRERGVTFSEGARILIISQVPQGKGVGSSAAIEVAVMQAIAASFDVAIQPREMALLCQKVENLVVGAPCGVMDQMTAMCGEAQTLLALNCQPAQLEGMVSLPDDIALWGLDSGIRHSVSGADYGSVRAGTFMGYRIIAELAGLTVRPAAQGQAVQIDDPKWRGYLANLTPSEWEEFYASRLPEWISGNEFLARYRGTTDPVTPVDPERTYGVRAQTAHPIYENFRVRAYTQLLSGAPSEQRRRLLGELMYQSHASYSACGLGSLGTDLLVKRVREAGPNQGLYGARITGGGSGGTVAVLGRRSAAEAVQVIAEQFRKETGYEPCIFCGSSPGASKFGYLKLKMER